MENETHGKSRVDVSKDAARQIERLQHQVELLQGRPIESFDCWSDDRGETWYESPTDAELLEGLYGQDLPKIGDEFELAAGWRSKTVRYRVTNVIHDPFEVRVVAVDEHVDDVAVNRFAAQMKERMAKKREEGRAGWHDSALCCAEFLSLKVWGSLYRGELIDAANYLMMLHQRGDKLACLRPDTEPVDSAQ